LVAQVPASHLASSKVPELPFRLVMRGRSRKNSSGDVAAVIAMTLALAVGSELPQSDGAPVTIYW
jgi:hypothetical protein